MSDEKVHFSSLADYHEFLGVPDPEHPLCSVISVQPLDNENMNQCIDRVVAISTDFYSISLKNIISGEFFYGRTKYDCRDGTMIFVAPRQEVRPVGVRVKSSGRVINIHEDFIRGHPIKDAITQYHYFSYAVNEALHLSPKEERMMAGLIDQIESEYHSNHDEFSKELILSQIDTLLKYANRFYHRQFLHRKENNLNLKAKFIAEVERCIAEEGRDGSTIPSVEQIADAMAMTPRYLSDALKVETGKTAMENLHLHLIDKAKDMLLGTDLSVSSIAYSLGFEYPQYFARLFKKKVGLTPTEYRNRIH